MSVQHAGAPKLLLLAERAEELQAGLQAFASVHKDVNQLLARLTRDLTKLNQVAQPIYNQAAMLAQAQENIGVAKNATDELLVHINTAKKLEPALRQGPGRDLPAYLKLLSQLHTAMHALEQHPTLAVTQQSHSYSIMVQQQALQDCEVDFVSVLTQQTTTAMPSASTLIQELQDKSLRDVVSHTCMPSFTTAALERLKAVAGLLESQQCTHSCSNEYIQVRSRALQQLLQGGGGLTAQLNTTTAATLTLEQADKAAAQWGQQLRLLAVAVAAEVALGQAIWGPERGLELAGSVAAPRLDVVVKQCQDMSKVRLQPVKVFVLLDMMQHLEEATPVLQELIGMSTSEACEQSLLALQEAQQALATTARELFIAFESGIAKDSSRAQAVDGTVHPLTAATLTHLRRLLSYGPVAQVLFVDRGRGGGGLAELSEHMAARKLREATRSCMAGLFQALEVKARAYKSKGLAQVFLMNNVHYVVVTAEQSDLMDVLGDTWQEQCKDIIERCGQEYHSLVWMPIIRQLRAIESGEDREPGERSKWKDWVKKHFKSVNSMLERVGNEQSGWSIPDDKLRAAVVRVILQDFLPAYQHFYARFSRSDFTASRNKYVRCSPDDADRMISNDLFKGIPMTVALASRSRSGGGRIMSSLGFLGSVDRRPPQRLATVEEPRTSYSSLGRSRLGRLLSSHLSDFFTDHNLSDHTDDENDTGSIAETRSWLGRTIF